eukprot:11118643-Alexandrium_andersonii.AAC.1
MSLQTCSPSTTAAAAMPYRAANWSRSAKAACGGAAPSSRVARARCTVRSRTATSGWDGAVSTRG